MAGGWSAGARPATDGDSLASGVRARSRGRLAAMGARPRRRGARAGGRAAGGAWYLYENQISGRGKYVKIKSNFERLALGCIEAEFCK